MKQYGFAYVTVTDKEEAKKIAQICLDQNLTACANIFPSMFSCYKWEGKNREEGEAVLLLKTRLDLFNKLRETVIQNHSYTCPCVVFVPWSAGAVPFLNWMDSQLTPPVKTD